MEFASGWVDITSKEVIEEGGYNEMPSMVTRWSRNSGEIYGKTSIRNFLRKEKIYKKDVFRIELNNCKK